MLGRAGSVAAERGPSLLRGQRLALVGLGVALSLALSDRWALLAWIQDATGISPALVKLVLVAGAAVGLLGLLQRRVSAVGDARALELSNRGPEALLGRQEDLETLMRLCERAPLVHLVGESGVGKSTLLRAGLLPALRTGAALHPVHIEALGSDWEVSPRAALAKALGRSLSREQREKLQFRGPISPEFTLPMLILIRQSLDLIPILIFDQFESYVIQWTAQLISHERGSWIQPDDLIAKNAFWRDLRNLLEQGIVHLLFALRDDGVDGIFPFTFQPPEVRRLERLSQAVVLHRLDLLTAHGFAARPERGWLELRERLAEDLSPGGWVLPVQMEIALQSLIHLQELTLRGYLRCGGLVGLEGQAIEREVAAAARVGRLHEVDSLNVLLALTADRRASRSRRFSELCEEVRRAAQAERRTVDDSAFGAVVKYYEQRGILRTSADPETDEPLWQLYHDYLARGVLEAERRTRTWSVLLREAHAAFTAASHRPGQRWRTLLPPLALARVLLERLRGRLQLGPQRTYVALSTLRLAPLPLLLLLAADAGLDFSGARQIRITLDYAHISLFREITSETELAVLERDLRERTLRILDARIDPAGWTQPELPLTGPMPDYWVHPQDITARLRDQALEPRALDAIFERLALMFEPGRVVESGGVAYGWQQSENFGYTRAEPLLWTGAAVARLLLRLHGPEREAQRSRALAWLSRVERSAAVYHSERDDAWNLFPNQKLRDVHSTYATTLAAMMLLDLRKLGAPFAVHGKGRDALLRGALQWLLQTHVATGSVPGWSESPPVEAKGVSSHQGISDALSLQIYSVLFRAVHELGAERDAFLPRELLEPVAAHGLAQLRDHLEEGVSTPQRLNMVFTTHLGEDRFVEANVSFLWYPWAVEAAGRGLSAAPELGWSSFAVSVLQQNLGRLLRSRVPAELDAVRFTFQAAELLYGLGGAEPAQAPSEWRLTGPNQPS